MPGKCSERKANINAGIRRVRSRISAREIKRDIRRKILVGATVLQRVDQNLESKKLLLRDLDEFLEHSRDRELFDLPPKPDSSQKTASEGS